MTQSHWYSLAIPHASAAKIADLAHLAAKAGLPIRSLIVGGETEADHKSSGLTLAVGPDKRDLG